jgi:hypothetical protein
MPFPLFDSVDGAVLNGYVDGLDNEFENEDFNPPAETEGKCRHNRVGATRTTSGQQAAKAGSAPPI